MIDSAGYAELVGRHPVLYHRVWCADEHLASILEHGLERVRSGYDGWWTSRVGHVYMGTRTAALAVKRSKGDEDRPWALLAIDVSQLEPARLNPDEDNFLVHNFCDGKLARRGERACRRLGLPFPPSKWLWEWARYLSIPFVNLGEWAEQVNLGSQPGATRHSIACGTLAYNGVVPASALRVVEEHTP